MVFSSIEFMIFLILTVSGFYGLQRLAVGRTVSLLFLTVASLTYYAYWNPVYILILLGSISVNFLIGQSLCRMEGRARKAVFVGGVAANLAALAWYKYMDFFVSTLNGLAGTDWPLFGIVLPLGISFFTFQQIAFLSDLYTRKLTSPGGIQSYALFIGFFPQLIAGPIVHHSQMMPQFDNNRFEMNWANMYNGLLLLFMGMAKKVLVADSLSPAVRVAFDSGLPLSGADAAFGMVAYTLQLYFDFSGYSDMAIGCALLFNVHLPENFFSPYKATSVQDFWRRWHMTLSAWLREYLYIPLGGNRQGPGRTLANLWFTFLLGGLWHGAAWTFVLWGAMHGTALVLHRLWSRFVGWTMPRLLGWGLTFVFVNLAWVAFRATSFESVGRVYGGLLGGQGWHFSPGFTHAVSAATAGGTFDFPVIAGFLGACLILTLVAPTTGELVRRHELSDPSLWKTGLGLCCGALAATLLVFPQRVTEFIYFQF